MSLLRRIEGQRPAGQQPAAPAPGTPPPPGGPPKPPSEGPLTQSASPTRDANRDVRIKLQTRIINNLGRRLDESKPYEDARLPDGSRVNIIIPPLALNGPVVTIRKFPKYRITVEDYIKFGTATAEMMEFMRACVEARLNMFISGGTGSGKTTLLNIMSGFIPEDERIITI